MKMKQLVLIKFHVSRHPTNGDLMEIKLEVVER